MTFGFSTTEVMSDLSKSNFSRVVRDKVKSEWVANGTGRKEFSIFAPRGQLLKEEVESRKCFSKMRATTECVIAARNQ